MKVFAKSKPKSGGKRLATILALTAVAAGLVWGARRVARKAEVQET
jgi:hypothetical protein